MSWLATVLLYLLHALYKLVLVFKSLLARFSQEPLPLAFERSKIPQHLALSLVFNPDADEETNEKYMLNSVEKVAAWCQVAGIRRLTVYDHAGAFYSRYIRTLSNYLRCSYAGILAHSYLEVRQRILPPTPGEDVDDSSVECDVPYPLTPPPSDDADSRPLSPHAGPSIPKLSVITMRYPTNPAKSKRRTSVSRTTLRRRRVNRECLRVPRLLCALTLAHRSCARGRLRRGL